MWVYFCYKLLSEQSNFYGSTFLSSFQFQHGIKKIKICGAESVSVHGARGMI